MTEPQLLEKESQKFTSIISDLMERVVKIMTKFD